jgi:hypothetical protein
MNVRVIESEGHRLRLACFSDRSMGIAGMPTHALRWTAR